VTAPSEFWQVLVYCSDSARGSPTGVVFPGRDLISDQYQAVASSLGYPDTVFLTPSPGNSDWLARSFSPAQELSLCTQALMAGFRVLPRRNAITSATHILFRTPSGPIEVSELIPDRKDVAWLVGPYQVLDRRVSKSPLAAIEALASAEEILIDTGRTRLFQELPDADRLSALALRPTQVMDYCAKEEIHGICLFAHTGEREIRMRVFTTSLDGGEDIATGGAVMGLLPYFQKKGAELPAGCWSIHQGFGARHQRGTLF
jgi:PhzF family phenazine biosynthesis protein